MFAAIIFDAYGTLFDTDSLGDVCERVFPGKGEAISQTWRQRQLQHSWLRTIMTRYADFGTITSDALQSTLRSMQLPYDRKLLKRLTDSYHTLDPFPDTAEMLDALRPVRMAILSNGSSAMLQELLSNSGLKDRFERVISAELTRVYKPAAAVYRFGQTTLKVPKSRTLFVSANAWDISGAKAFGFVTAWINRRGETFDELHSRPDYEVSSLGEIPRIIRR